MYPFRLVLMLTALLGAATGCATNPATGGADFVLMSEDQELAIGRKSHAEILKAYGEYDDPALQAYVRGIGEELAQESDRGDLIYRFTVLDSPVVNAFALPGGYIYITRGMLAHLNSEAQLAAVLGHEIGHVTARHSVRQHAASTTVGLLGAVLAASTGVQGAGDLANVAGTAIVRGYGREMELEADRLGAEYVARVGYAPDAMLDVIALLKAQEQLEQQLAKEEGREPRSYHGLFSTHPDNDQRLKEVIGAAGAIAPRGQQRPAHRARYLAHIDGMVYGDSEAQGIRRGHRFYHGPLGFAIDFPRDWVVENGADRVVARSRDGEAAMLLLVEDLNRRITPREFIEQRLKLTPLADGRALDGGAEGYTALADLPIRGRHPRGRVAVRFLDDRAYVLLGSVAKAARLETDDPLFRATIDSFRRLGDNERVLARPLRLHPRPIKRGETLAGLARASPIPDHAEARLRLINGLYPSGTPTPGEPFKLVR